ncbi:MAG: hypothetical protein MRY72_07945 [Aquisalinus sp.]|nr:hypothetical protein [Aquisalinus sp.]
MLKVSTGFAVLAVALAGTAAAADYEHEAWPVENNGEGIYAFTDTGKASAIPLCTAFYAADLKAMAEFNEQKTAYSAVIEEHAQTMFTAYRSKFTGSEDDLSILTTDMTWHFGNAAQYGNYQEFKDSANMACESYAVNNDVVTFDYLSSFNDELLSAL